MGWKGTLGHPRADLSCGVLPKGVSKLIPVSWGRLLAPFSQLLLPSHPHEVAACCEVMGVTPKAPRGTGALSLLTPHLRNPPHSPPFQAPVSQKQHGSVRGAVLCSVLVTQETKDGVEGRDVLLAPKSSFRAAPELFPCQQ